MKRTERQLQPAVERFLKQVQRIDLLRAELEEFEHFEAAAVPKLLDSIETSRGTIRDARRTLREVRAEHRRQEQQLIRLRRACGLEHAAQSSDPRPVRQPQPDACLATGCEMLRRLAECREALACASRRMHAGLSTSYLTVQRSHDLLQKTLASESTAALRRSCLPPQPAACLPEPAAPAGTAVLRGR